MQINMSNNQKIVNQTNRTMPNRKMYIKDFDRVEFFFSSTYLHHVKL